MKKRVSIKRLVILDFWFIVMLCPTYLVHALIFKTFSYGSLWGTFLVYALPLIIFPFMLAVLYLKKYDRPLFFAKLYCKKHPSIAEWKDGSLDNLKDWEVVGLHEFMIKKSGFSPALIVEELARRKLVAETDEISDKSLFIADGDTKPMDIVYVTDMFILVDRDKPSLVRFSDISGYEIIDKDPAVRKKRGFFYIRIFGIKGYNNEPLVVRTDDSEPWIRALDRGIKSEEKVLIKR